MGLLGTADPGSGRRLDWHSLRSTQFDRYTWFMSNLQERAVRRYLDFLTDPKSFMANPTAADDELIAELEKQFVQSQGSIEKLRVLSSIEQAKRPDRPSLEAAFVAHARDWAQANDIAPNAFARMGVEPELLQRAGFEKVRSTRPASDALRRDLSSNEPGSKKPSAGSATTKTDRARARQAPPVRLDQIVPVILEQSNRFTIAQVHELAGGSRASVRTAVLSLVASGKVRASGTKVGLKGKAPTLYEVVSR
jgi:hypothetical protein